ncbi:hypothetical protein [Arundinibacter roseus]|uniref:Uncharacterized protein n=1 Tax=Arundinibacter roseus TaxID=2070510 RepID=A0A4R4KJ63_9BACT|nr:hypothetical protein [Arundinibacter roseus]TDB66902.1 hypothetical protein EZE20_07190 [Arundinibacter roseus]
MTIVDKETFAYWVTHPNDIEASNLARLEHTAQAFPYCQISYTLLAKVASESDSPRLPEFIPLAAVHSLNRKGLRRIIENEFAWSEAMLNRLSDLPHGRTDSRNNATPYGLDKPISLVRFEDRFKKYDTAPDREAAHETNVPKFLPVDDTVLTEKVIEEELTHKKLKVAPIPVIELLPLPTPKEDERRKQQEIIEAFIKNDPRIGPIRVNKNEAEIQPVDLLSHRSQPMPMEGLATESFAKILVKQGKIDKAIDMYQKLMLKNPEKKDYFAEKIAELNANS